MNVGSAIASGFLMIRLDWRLLFCFFMHAHNWGSKAATVASKNCTALVGSRRGAKAISVSFLCARSKRPFFDTSHLPSRRQFAFERRSFCPNKVFSLFFSSNKHFEEGNLYPPAGLQVNALNCLLPTFLPFSHTTTRQGKGGSSRREEGQKVWQRRRRL